MNEQIKMEVPYFQVPNKIFEIGLNNYELVVYMYLARCGNYGGTAFPSYNTIAKKCGISRRKAIDVVKILIEKNLLYKQYRYNEVAEENYSNIYVVNHVIEGSAQDALGSEHNALGNAQDAPNKKLTNKELNIKIIKGILTEVKNSYDYLDVINYYLNYYEGVMREEHPILSKEHWTRVINALGTVNLEISVEDVSEDDEIKMIDKHFNTDYKKDNIYCDYNILHYISGDIRKNRYFECVDR